VVTPTDFLVIFHAVIAPRMVGSLAPHGNVMAIGAKAVKLFYALELLISRVVGREMILRCIVVGALAMLTLKSVASLPLI